MTRTGVRDRGSMLIVALGILTLLSVLAITFVNLMKLERSASANYVEGVKARMIAEAGVSRFVSEVKFHVVKNPTRFPPPWAYEWDGGRKESRVWVKVEESTAPSFLASGSLAASSPRRYSGWMGASYRTGGQEGSDVYTLKVIDTSNQVYLNGPQDTMALMLDTLGAAIALVRGGRNPVKDVKYLSYAPGGKSIVAFRDTQDNRRFGSKYQLKQLYDQQGLERDFEVLKDYVTERAWLDPLSARPEARNILLKPAGVLLEARAPVNFNTAPKEVVMAVIAGIAGRRVYLRPEKLKLENLEAGTDFAGRYTSSQQEETEYEVVPYYVAIEPVGMRPTGPSSFDLSQASQIADKLLAGRPYFSFAHLADFIDRNITEAMLPKPRDCKLILDRNEMPVPAATLGAIVARDDFAKFYVDAARDLLKANLNPCAPISSYNPSKAVALAVDKGNLIYYTPPTATGGAAKAEQRYTCDACFATRGVFEVTSLGEIWKPGDSRPLAQEKVRSVVQVMDVVTHRTQRDFERWGKEPKLATYRHSQGQVITWPENRLFWDYENPPDNLGFPVARGEDTVTNPYTGWLELEARTPLSGDNGYSTFFGSSKADERFAALFERRRKFGEAGKDRFGRYWADRANGTDTPLAVSEADEPFASPQGFLKTFGYTSMGDTDFAHLFPDGVYTSLRRPLELRAAPPAEFARYLWFRASCDTVAYRSAPPNPIKPAANAVQTPDEHLQGLSLNNPGKPGNVGVVQGALDFWWKPDFDWMKRNPDQSFVTSASNPSGKAPTEVVCGLIFASSVTPNNDVPAQPDGLKPLTKGTQMYVTRNSAGWLRVTRLYYEVVGQAGSTARPTDRPLVKNPKPVTNDPDPVDINTYRTFTRDRSATDYPWPPADMKPLTVNGKDVKFARVDCFISPSEFAQWRANEWHHVAVAWDDSQGAADQVLRIFVDGKKKSASTTLPASAGDKLFVRLNEPATIDAGTNERERRPKDCLFVGGIARKQAIQGGLFKFVREVEMPANGTIDNVRVYAAPGLGLNRNDLSPVPERFPDAGVYRQRFDMADRFPPGSSGLELAGVAFEAMMPSTWNGQSLGVSADGQVKVQVFLNGDGNEVGGGRWLQPNQPTFFPIAQGGAPYRMRRADDLFYQLSLRPMLAPGGLAVDTPVVTEVSLYYFLPTESVLLKERLYD